MFSFRKTDYFHFQSDSRISISEAREGKLSELNTCQARENDNIFNIIDQIMDLTVML